MISDSTKNRTQVIISGFQNYLRIIDIDIQAMLTVLSFRLPRGRRVNAILARCGKPVEIVRTRTRRDHKSMAISEGEKEGRVENTHGLVKVEGRRKM
jgi:hypothetical protein